MRPLQSSKSPTDRSHSTRPLVVAVLVVLTIGTSGCHWFNKRGNPYQKSAETRPLEVPPDLDRPNTEGAMEVPGSATQTVQRSSMPTGQAQASSSGFTVTGDRDDIFNKVGTALAGTEGVTIASKAQLLGTYDVSYKGANFLIRVVKVDAGVYVSAVDPRGQPATSEAATSLVATLKSAIGG